MKTIFPKKIIKTSENIENAKTLLVKKTLQIGIDETDYAVLKSGGYIILDFGKEYVGSIRILTFIAQNSKKIRIRLGESVGETCSEINKKGATNDHANRDYVVELQGYSDMTFNSSGFRFVRLDVVEDAVLLIKNVVIESTLYNKNSVGKFSCDDKIINKIFSTAERTIRCCIQNGMVWDGAKRDRLVWIGDMYPETTAINCLFGNIKEVKNSFEFIKSQYKTWFNNMPAYSLWWIIMLKEDYVFWGEKEYLESNFDKLDNIVKEVNKCVKNNGETDYISNFIDWPTHYTQENKDEIKRQDELAGMHALTTLAILNAEYIYEILGKNKEICNEILNKLSKKQYVVKKHIQVSAIRCLAGISTQKDIDLIKEKNVHGMSTFMSYIIFSALAKANEYKLAFDILKEYYGKMLELGATTFWEDFNIDWSINAYGINKLPQKGKDDIHGDFGAHCYTGYRHSLCHGWSCGVIPYLFYYVAGIKVLDAGCRKIRISPHLGELKNVKISYPTPYGKIVLEIKKANGKEQVNILACPKKINII